MKRKVRDPHLLNEEYIQSWRFGLAGVQASAKLERNMCKSDYTSLHL